MSQVTANGNFILVSDITGVTTMFTPNFTGIFDGNGHTINMDITSPAQISCGCHLTSRVAGLFKRNESGTIKNLKLTGTITFEADFVGRMSAGAVASCNSGTIENVVSTVDVTVNNTSELEGSSAVAGGIVSYISSGTIKNSYSTGNILARFQAPTNPSSGVSSAYSAGIAGEIRSALTTVEYCMATGTVTVQRDAVTNSDDIKAGGIVGEFFAGSVINNVALNTTVKTNFDNNTIIGRIVGRNFSGTHNNNHANSGMSLLYDDPEQSLTPTAPDLDIDGKHGADFTSTGQAAWTDIGWIINGSADAASEDSPWVWDSGSNRPKLWFE
jgi:hypothetical protein